MKQNVSSSLVMANAPKMIMGMLIMSVLTIFSSCTKEEINYHATSRSDLMVEVDSTMTLGKTTVDIEGTATNADGSGISALLNLVYTCIPEIEVEELGMPVNKVGESTFAADGTMTDNFSDTQVVNRKSLIQANGVNLSSVGTFVQATLIPVNETSELVVLEYSEAWSAFAQEQGSKSGSETVKLLYRHTKKQIIVPDVVTYEWTAPVDEVAGGVAYVDVTVKRLRNGVVEKSWGVYTSGIRFGEYKPSVASVVVNSYNFNTTDWLEALATEADKVNQGDEGAFTIVNSAKQQAHLSVVFGAPADANGSTEREIAGHVNLWSYDVIFTDPETGHVETISFKAKAETVKNEVENGSYVRTVNILSNGEVVKVQNGSVALTLAQ